MKKLCFLLTFTMFSSAGALQAQNRQVRDVAQFKKISLAVAGKLYLKQGSPQRVELEADDEVLERIVTEVHDGRLKITRKDNRPKSDGKIIAYVTVPDIEAVTVSGSGEVVGQSKIKTDDLDLKVSGSGSLTLDIEASGDVEAGVSGSGRMNLSGRCESLESDVAGSGKVVLSTTIRQSADFGVSGSGKIEAKGTADQVKAAIAGSGKVLAADLETNLCEVKISGSGDVEINVKHELEVNITGSGSVSYRGSPKKVNSHASGSGRVRKI